MGKVVIYGAGAYGQIALEFIGKDNIDFFIDRDIKKQDKGFNGIRVYSLDEAIKQSPTKTIVALENRTAEKVVKELRHAGLGKCITFADFKMATIRENISKRPNYIEMYRKAINWIKNNSVPGEGIINTSDLRKSYPEVTGYFIPSLYRWGYRELALSYGKWLCSIQKEDGSWYDTEDNEPYIFDSAQILKGLIYLYENNSEIDNLKECIIKGIDWILTNMTSEGRLVAPRKDTFFNTKMYSELIHTYCISPIKEAGVIFNRQDYVANAELIGNYYTQKHRDEIVNFDLLSHFYAYVMEAMIDIGREDMAKEAMAKIALIQKESGAVPAFNNVDWVCSTGMFQLAIVWYRLGDIDRGDKAFSYASRLQNESGGWFGSYLSEENGNEENTYFPNSEISWACKYFLDAISYRNIALFDEQAQTFGFEIGSEDGRYKAVKCAVESGDNTTKKILDVGCGKGRYLRNLVKDYPDNNYYAVDLSAKVMRFFDDVAVYEKKRGNLTNIPYPDNYFDVVYTCEALEHAVDIEMSVRELCRVTKQGGRIVIVDKNREMMGFVEIEEWEQWFDEKELCMLLSKYCKKVEVDKKIGYDNQPPNNLFYAWIAIK